MLPGAGHLVRQALRLGLTRHFDGLAAGRLRCPAPDVHLADILAFGLGLLRRLLAHDPEGLEVREVGAQPSVNEVTNRGVRAEIAVQPLEHIVVARDGGALEALLALALGEPSLDGLAQGDQELLSLRGADACLGIREKLLQPGLGVLRGQVLRRRLRAVGSAPDDRAARRPATRVLDVCRTQPASMLAFGVLPEGVVGPCATILSSRLRKAISGVTRIASDTSARLVGTT